MITVLESIGVQKSWLAFKDHLLQAQGTSIPTSRKSNRGGRRKAVVLFSVVLIDRIRGTN